MYQPIRSNTPRRELQATSFAAKGGINFSELPQLLSPAYAQSNKNYLILPDGGLSTRKGMSLLFTQTGSVAITAIERYDDTYWVIGYGTKLDAYNTVTGALTNIKTFGTTGTFSLQRYGAYMFVTNGTEAIGRITYSAGWSYTTLTAPTCGVLKVVGARLFAGNLSTDATAVAYSDIDDGTNPPFTSWTAGTLADDPGLLNFRNAGPVRAIESLGQNVLVFADNGKWSFYINTIDSAGTLKKVDVTQISRLDLGGSRCAVATPRGLFYANEAGLWNLVSIGQPNIKFSDQESMTSSPLGTKYFDNIDLTNADIFYHPKYDTIFLTCAKGSSSNNHVITYHVSQKAFGTLSGWNLNRFLNVDNANFYGVSSSSVPKCYKLFDGYTDAGTDIWTEFEQELKTGELETRQALLGGYIQGLLSASSVVNINFDIYDVNGNLISNKLKLEWTPQSGSTLSDGYGTASWGTSAWGGDTDLAGMVESFDGWRDMIRNYQRIIVRITSHGKVPHQLNWLKLNVKSKTVIRRRKITNVT